MTFGHSDIPELNSPASGKTALLVDRHDRTERVSKARVILAQIGGRQQRTVDDQHLQPHTSPLHLTWYPAQDG